MSMKSVAKDLGRSIIGMPNRAVITIDDFRSSQPTSTVSGEDAVQSAGDLVEGIGGALSDAVGEGSTKTFNVQFNPNELSIYAHSSPVIMKTLQTLDANQLQEQIASAPSTSLTVKLIFDDVNIRDAFMSEKISLTASGVVAGMVDLGRTIKDDKIWSVRTPMNALIAAILNEDTRSITFNWATFSFQGVIEAVSADYTMFSVSGEPIRGTIDLKIKQSLSISDSSQWSKSFDAMFQSGNSMADLSSVSSKVGNIVNI